MRLGIMQPYFFPYLGHFALINAVDEWIVFDITQYTPKTWMNRNRVLHPAKGWQYVTLPLSNSSIGIRTHEARLLDLRTTKTTISGKLSHYRNKAPYFRQVNDLVNEVFSSAPDDSLVHLNVRALDAVCRYLQIPFKYRICSEMKLAFPEQIKAGEWALEISAQLRATSYLNPISGRDIFDASAFANRGIDLQFARTREFVYTTSTYEYVPNLSILDVMMWNSQEDVTRAVSEILAIEHATCKA